MLDETTDCTVTEQLIIHGRCIDCATGELKSHYSKVIDILQPEIEAQGLPPMLIHALVCVLKL